MEEAEEGQQCGGLASPSSLTNAPKSFGRAGRRRRRKRSSRSPCAGRKGQPGRRGGGLFLSKSHDPEERRPGRALPASLVVGSRR